MKKVIVIMMLILGMSITSLTAQFCDCGPIQVSDLQIGGGMQAYSFVIDVPTDSNTDHRINGLAWYAEVAFQFDVVQLQAKFSKAIGDIVKGNDLRIKDYRSFNLNLNYAGDLDNDLGPLVGFGVNWDTGKNHNLNHNLKNRFKAISIHGQAGAWVNLADAIKFKLVVGADYYLKDNLVDLVKNGSLNEIKAYAEFGTFITIGG